MTFLDTSTLVGALLANHPQQAACLRALQEARNPVSDAHALAETFATLTGFYKVPSKAAAELALGLRAVVQVDPLSLADYETAISAARQRGIMGAAFTIRSTRPLNGAKVLDASSRAI